MRDRYEIDMWSFGYAADTGKGFSCKADALKYARAYYCPEWEYVAILNTRTKRADVIKGNPFTKIYAPYVEVYKRGVRYL